MAYFTKQITIIAIWILYQVPYNKGENRKMAIQKKESCMKRNNAVIIGLLILATAIIINLEGCMITFINDSKQAILIYDLNDKNNKNSSAPPKMLPVILKGNRWRFGRADEHAHFTIYIKTQKSKINKFNLVYEVTQKECGEKGNPEIKFTDLENNTGNAHLFTITANHEPHVSMVQQLPMLSNPDIDYCPTCNITEKN